MWHSFVHGFSDIIQLFYSFTVKMGVGNYGLAIILITILLKVLLYPLSARQMSSVKAMQELQPMVKDLQERYKGQPEKAQKAVMELYKEHKVNPLAGCFPLLIQMPIIIAFYQALLRLEYLVPAHAGFLWIANLSMRDTTFILPILTAASTYWQQKVSTTNTKDQMQKYMLYFMPLFIGYIASTFPAGLALYWVVFSVIGALQQIYVNRKHNKAQAIVETGAVSTAKAPNPANKDISKDTDKNSKKATKAEAKPESKPARKTKKGDRRRNAR